MVFGIEVNVKTKPFFYAGRALKPVRRGMVRDFYEFHTAWKGLQGTKDRKDLLDSCIGAIEGDRKEIWSLEKKSMHKAPSLEGGNGSRAVSAEIEKRKADIDRNFHELKYRLAAADGEIGRAAESLESVQLNDNLKDALLSLARAELASLSAMIDEKTAFVGALAKKILADTDSGQFFANVKKLQKVAQRARKISGMVTRPVAVIFTSLFFWTLKLINERGLTMDNISEAAKVSAEGKNVPFAVGTVFSFLVMGASYYIKKAAENDIKIIGSLGKTRGHAEEMATKS